MIDNIFIQVQAGTAPLSSGITNELLFLFHETVSPYFQSGASGTLVIMLFILLVSYVLTQITINPLKIAYNKQRLFAANASHELRTPLSVLKTLAEVATMRSNELTKEEINQFTKDIGEEVDRMSHIIEFFVRFSALESGGQRLQMSPVRLSRLTESVVSTLEQTAIEHDVRIVTADNMPGVVHGNYTALEELLINLVKNAITFSPRGSMVRIASKDQSASVDLMVSDNGVGIPNEDLPHIFEPFYHKNDKKHNCGSGVGLSLVRQLAKLHRAKVVVDTKIGIGTTFTVVFPK